MNIIQQTEIITLQAIFPDSFKQISETRFSLQFYSTFYKTLFSFDIEYSPDYPNQRLSQLSISSTDDQDLLEQIKERFQELELQLLNSDQGYVYQLITSLDDEQIQVSHDIQETYVQEEVEEVFQFHGQIPGHPVTDASYQVWFNEYIQRKGIKLLEQDDWTKVDFTKPISPDCTGFEWFKRKSDEK